ncbi:MAG TPA: NAD(P)H-binding protein, partial [Polyangia bacterium]|nr:NAD(P)H-binding protein [Polyangia bacterium]
MRIAVLGATGQTGRQLVGQALARGHEVVALARDPRKVTAAARLRVVAADVFAPATMAAALAGVDAVASGLGAESGGDGDGTLAAGARAVAVAGIARVVW